MHKTLAVIIMSTLTFVYLFIQEFPFYGIKHWNFRQSFRFLLGFSNYFSLFICQRVHLIHFQGVGSLDKIQEEN